MHDIHDGNGSQDRVAVVSGGGSGIGRAFCARWVHGGGRVVVLDRDAAAVDATVASLTEEGTAPDRVRGAVADVSRDEELAQAIQRVGEQLTGVIDVVVNCAGIARPGRAAEAPDAQWSELLDIHVNGTMRMCRAAYPFLTASTTAAIVNVSSVAAAAGMPGRSSYCAAKAGIEGLTRALAVEWAPDRIRVNAVAPGYVDSAMIQNLLAAGELDLGPVLARTPMHRLADPDEIAAAIAFLSSTDASYVTGQVLYVDGGMTVDGNWY